MKIQTKNLLKSIVSLALCLSMVLCTPLMAFAEENNGTATPKKADIVYVSIGDSMTNGYCLDGYDGNSGAVNYAKQTYANLFSAYLAGYDPKNIANDQVIFEGNKATVDHRQLAISGLRSQDIQWILELDYTDDALLKEVYNGSFDMETWVEDWEFNGDARTWNDFCSHDYRYADAATRILTVYNHKNGNGNGYFSTTSSYLIEGAVNNAYNGVFGDNGDPYYPQNTAKDQTAEIGGYKFFQIATEFYQESVKEADIISLAVGNTNFGTHMLTEVMDVIMSDDKSFTADKFDLEREEKIANDNPITKKIVENLRANKVYQTTLAACKAFAGNDTDKQDRIEYIVEYCTIAYINGYVGMLNAILAANPDVEIIILPLMNAYEKPDGTVDEGSLGALVKAIYGPINVILENLSGTYGNLYPNAEFYFSEECHVSCMVDVYGDDFYKNSDNSYVDYPGFINGAEGYTANTNSIVRERFVEEIVCGSMLFAKMGLGKPNTQENIREFLYGNESKNLCGVIAYDMMTYEQKAAYAATNADAAKEYALYLAFENALIRSGTQDITMGAIASMSGLSEYFKTFQPQIQAAIGSASLGLYEEAASVVVAKSNGTLSVDNVLSILDAVETIKTAIWNNVASYHSYLATIGHTSIDDVLECATCNGNGHNPQLNAITGGIISAYNEQMDLLPYTIIANKAESQTGGLLNNKDIKKLCEEESYADAVYSLISEKSNGQMTKEHVKTLHTDGVWVVAGAIAGYDADTIQKAYEMNMFLTDEQRAQIETLMSVRTSIIALFEYESTFKTSAAALKTSIPTIVESVPLLAYLLAIPQAMGDALAEDDTMSGALCMNARILLGTGAGGHPSLTGHETLYNSIIEVFDYTVSDAEWNEDFTECTVTRTFSDGSTKTAEAKEITLAETKASTCKEQGYNKYVAVFDEYWAATAYNTVTLPLADHDYTKFTAPVWTWSEDYKASAIFTCPDCNTPVDVTEDVTISGGTTLEADCSKEGKYVYTATVEFKGKTYTDTKEKVIAKLEHNYGEDGRCTRLLNDGTVCGVYNLAQFGQCDKTVSSELVSGNTLTMLLDGTNLGEFTFTETDSGWAIADGNGKYLASDANGNFVLSDSAYSWNYSDGKFSTTVKVPGTTWYEQLLGITKDVTYYLAVSDGSVTVNATGSSAAFTTTANNGYHTFNGVTVIEPNCTEEGHTERVCTVCGETFKTDVTPSLGHNHVPTVHAPLCGIKGYTEYTCSVCGDSYTGDEVPALEHDFNDNDECNNCHKSQLELSGGCSEKVESSVSNGEYILSLGGTEVGTYTFASVNGGWSIKDANGKYLSVDSNGNLVLSDSAFAWTYSNGKFSATVGKASTNWIEALLGMNKKSTTYYLVASGSSVATSTTGADAKFYTEVSNATHTFNKIDHAASCGIDAYSEYVCDVCGYTFVKEFDGTALQHSYSVTETVEVSCTADGYTKYTCSNCGDSYVTNVVTSSGHNFVDGFCTVCGEPEEPDCVYVTEQTLTSGKTYELSLGGNSVGEYTFTSVSDGWNIMNSEGKYLAVEGGKLVVSDSPFAWTYSNGRFSSSSSEGTGISWLDMILGSKKSTYYLASSGNNVTVSTSTSAATAKFTAEVTGEHNYSGAKPVDGNHVYTCHNCGYDKIEICNDDNCAICNASVNVSVNIEETTSGNWIELLLGKGKKTNKVTITTVASGTEVTSVEYSLNGTTWTKGTVFTSKTAVTNFNIRVQAANGITYNYLYNNGSVSAI